MIDTFVHSTTIRVDFLINLLKQLKPNQRISIECENSKLYRVWSTSEVIRDFLEKKENEESLAGFAIQETLYGDSPTELIEAVIAAEGGDLERMKALIFTYTKTLPK